MRDGRGSAAEDRPAMPSMQVQQQADPWAVPQEHAQPATNSHHFPAPHLRMMAWAAARTSGGSSSPPAAALAADSTRVSPSRSTASPPTSITMRPSPSCSSAAAAAWPGAPSSPAAALSSAGVGRRSSQERPRPLALPLSQRARRAPAPPPLLGGPSCWPPRKLNRRLNRLLFLEVRRLGAGGEGATCCHSCRSSALEGAPWASTWTAGEGEDRTQAREGRSQAQG